MIGILNEGLSGVNRGFASLDRNAHEVAIQIKTDAESKNQANSVLTPAEKNGGTLTQVQTIAETQAGFPRDKQRDALVAEIQDKLNIEAAAKVIETGGRVIGSLINMEI